MKRLILITVIVLIPMAVCFAENNILNDLKGEWINQAYIQDVARNKSPRRTIDHYEYPALIVEKKKLSMQVMLIINFHEGLSFVPKKVESVASGKSFKIYLDEMDGMPGWSSLMFMEGRREGASLKVTLTLSSGDPKIKGKTVQQKYIRAISSIQQAVNSKVLEGDYTDEGGRLISFDKNMMAIWPDKKFKYEICLDIDSSTDDCFFETDKTGNKSKGYYFRWENKTLIIKEMNEGYDKAKILFKLRKK